MTCGCPKRWCYGRADCRHPKPPPCEPVEPVEAARDAWLFERRAAIVKELVAGLSGRETPRKQRNRARALDVINAAIDRRSENAREER